MEELLAKIGYTLLWGLGVPDFGLEEAFTQCFVIGAGLMILASASIIALITICAITIFAERRKGKNG